MVDVPPSGLEWKGSDGDTTRSYHRDGRVKLRLGRGVQWSSYRWPLVGVGTTSLHKLSGTVGRSVRGTIVCNKQDENPCEIKDGQQNSCRLYQPTGGNQVSDPSVPSEIDLGLGTGPGNNPERRTSARDTEHDSLQGIREKPSIFKT